LVSTPDNADDRLAAGVLALASKDPALAEKHFEEAESLGAEVGPYLAPLAAAAFARARQLLDEKDFKKAGELLANLEQKYAPISWFSANKPALDAARAQAKAGIYEAEAEKLYQEAADLFAKQELFDVKPLVEKLKIDYAESKPVTDATRKPAFMDLEQSTANLGPIITVRQDGKGNFTTIQAAIDAAEPDTLIEVEDNGPYNEELVVPSGKTGLTIRGKRGCWPVVTSAGDRVDIDVLVSVEAEHTTLERLVLSHMAPAPAAQDVRCIRSSIGGIDSNTPRLRCCIVAATVAGEILHGGFLVEDSLVVGKWTYGSISSANSLWLVPRIAFTYNSYLRTCTVLGSISVTERRSCAVVDSIVVGNMNEGSDVELRVECCDVLGKVQNAKPGRGCISADPLFRDPANLDYRLMPTSPCIGKASDGGDIGCRYTPEMIEMCEKALELRAKGIIKF
ncbi:MAG: hypothetical protein ABIP48_17570, partial [Planctomycetota bacterium]